MVAALFARASNMDDTCRQAINDQGCVVSCFSAHRQGKHNWARVLCYAECKIDRRHGDTREATIQKLLPYLDE